MALHNRLIGAHISIAQGLTKMVHTVATMNATTFQFFASSPRSARAKEWSADDIEGFNTAWSGAPFVAHAPYILNLSGKTEELRAKAIKLMKRDRAKIEAIHTPYYNIHPGSHVGQGTEKGRELVSEGLKEIIDSDSSSLILLETMAGKGTEIGRTFEDLATIRKLVGRDDRIGFLIDTCHIWDGGYDIRDTEHFIEMVDNILGIENVKAIHLNDSKNEMGSHKDRHEKLGEGKIGLASLVAFTRHQKLQSLPFILETPQDIAGYKKEIEIIRKYPI